MSSRGSFDCGEPTLMNESQDITTSQLANRVSHVTLGIALTIGSIAASRASQWGASSVELYQGMNLKLPLVTKLFAMSPLGKFILPVILLALIAKEFVLKDKPMSRLTANGAGLMLILIVRELYFQASLLPLIQLIGNLG